MTTPTPLLLREGKYLPTTSHVFRNTTRDVLTITNDEIIATGTITASNINVINKVTTFNEVHIRNDSNTVPFTITHTGVNANIMEIGDERRIGFVINNNGNVGIGALAPVAPFHAVHAPVIGVASTSNFTPYGLAMDTRYGEGHAVSDDGLSLFVGIPGSSQVSYIRRATLASEWMPIGTILPNVESRTAGSDFGSTIKISNGGDALWVSAPGIERLFRFDRNGIEWNQGLQLQRSGGDGGGAESISYGTSFAVSADGSNVVVGTPSLAGSVGGFYIHSWSNGAWSTSNVPGTELGLTENSYLGSAVDMSADGQWIFVGAYGAVSGIAGGTGSVFVYKSVGEGYNGYSNVQKLTGDVGMLHFGRSISVNGNFVAIGAQANVVVFKYGGQQSGFWSRYQTIPAPMATASFGTSVSLDANQVLVVGDPVDNVHGEVRIFTHHATYFQEMLKTSPAEVETVGYGRQVTIGANSRVLLVHGYGLDNRGLLYVIGTTYSEKDGICVQMDANVGIGTTIANSKLEVFGDVNVVGTLRNYGVPVGYGSLGTARNTLQVAPCRYVHEVSAVASTWSYVLDGRYIVSADKTDVYVNGVKLLYTSVAGGIQDYSVSSSNVDDKTHVTLSLRDAPAYSDFVEVVFWPAYAQLDGTNNFGTVFQTFNGWFENANDGTSNIYYDKGNVGIGTMMPKASLHVQSQSIFIGNVGLGTTVPMQSLHVQNRSFFSGNVGLGTTAPRQLLDVQGGNAIVSGNVGIGTAAPTQSLTVQGNLYLSGTISAGNLGMFRNRIINGNFDVWQRGTSFNVTVNNIYVADRWRILFNGTGAARTVSQQQFTVGQTDVPNEPTYFLRYNQSVAGTGGTFTNIEQPIEGVRTLAGQAATVSFYAKADADRVLTVILTQAFGTGGSPSANVYTTIGSAALSTSWAKYSFSFNVPSISGKNIGTNRNDYLGLAFRPELNVIQTIDIAQVQLESGNMATPFEFRPYSVEMQLCQRYCVRLAAYGAYSRFGFATGNATTSAYAIISLPVPMRANAGSPGVSSASLALQASSIAAVTGLTVNTTDTTPTCLAFTATTAGGLTVGACYVLIANNNANAYIQVDTEL